MEVLFPLNSHLNFKSYPTLGCLSVTPNQQCCTNQLRAYNNVAKYVLLQEHPGQGGDEEREVSKEIQVRKEKEVNEWKEERNEWMNEQKMKDVKERINERTEQ